MDEVLEVGCGAYSFCKGCPSDQNCCTGKHVDKPVLTRDDIARISEVTGLDAREFCEKSQESLAVMRSVDDACHFYHEGRCSIYDARPIDCRLFPFDVAAATDGSISLISYNSACPKSIDVSPYVKNAESLLPMLGTQLAAFANYGSPKLDCQPHMVHRTIRKI